MHNLKTKTALSSFAGECRELSTRYLADRQSAGGNAEEGAFSALLASLVRKATKLRADLPTNEELAAEAAARTAKRSAPKPQTAPKPGKIERAHSETKAKPKASETRTGPKSTGK